MIPDEYQNARAIIAGLFVALVAGYGGFWFGNTRGELIASGSRTDYRQCLYESARTTNRLLLEVLTATGYECERVPWKVSSTEWRCVYSPVESVPCSESWCKR